MAEHFGKDPEGVWNIFLEKVREEFRGQTLNGVVARRVRSRVGDLLDGAFNGAQVVADLTQTEENHSATLTALNLHLGMKATLAPGETGFQPVWQLLQMEVDVLLDEGGMPR
jgi:hypothetical protein